MTLTCDLTRAKRAYDAAAKHAEAMRGARNALIKTAHAEGMTDTAIAEALGIARQQIAVIARGRRTS
jgi:hypothetical protein